jgi:hypothetical protein
MDADFPAAHSMDTAFFAVDRDGHVAFFRTGEAGAAPAYAAAHPDEAQRQLARLVPASEPAYDRQGRVLPGPEPRSEPRHWSQVGNAPDSILFFMDSLPDFVQTQITKGRAVQLPATNGVAVFFERPSRALVKRLHKDGLCRGCSFEYRGGEDEEYERDHPDVSRHGVFVYGHLCENWISGPYGRECVPRQPVHIDQLPPAVRRLLLQVHFDKLCFADTPHIQPVEHTECVSWESAYLTSDGKTVRPIPGSDENYLDALDHLREMDGLVFDPPLSEEEPEE